MFVLEDFIANPEVEGLTGLTKNQWFELANYYELEPRASLRKDEVLTHLVETEIFTEDDIAVLDSPSDLLILKRLQLQIAQAENEKLKLQISQGSSTPGVPFRLSDAIKFVPPFKRRTRIGSSPLLRRRQHYIIGQMTSGCC